MSFNKKLLILNLTNERKPRQNIASDTLKIPSLKKAWIWGLWACVESQK